MSNFSSINTALTGLRAAQVGMETSTHNISNANTKGYTRQRVEQASRSPYQSAIGLIGTGVEISGITRSRDAFLDARARASTAEFRFYDGLASLLQRSESISGEPENGITSQANEVWAAFEDLALDPSDAASRRQVIASLESMTSRVRTVSEQWDILQSDTATRLSVGVDEANDSLVRLDQINKLLPASGGSTARPNDLLNERDMLLDKLSGLLNVTTTFNTDNTVTLTLPTATGPVTLVGGGQPPDQLSANASGTITSNATGAAVTVGGETGGLQRFMQQELPALRRDLAAFVETFTATINGQHSSGYRASDDGTTSVAGGPLLTFDPAGGLSTFKVAISRPDEIATAGAPGAAGGPPAPHDGQNATALAGLRTRPITTTSGGVTTTSTLDDRLRGIVVNLGRAVAAATRSADSAEGLMTSGEMARQSVHGVSIDEEMVNVVTYQRALEAASRVMSAIDEMLDVLINRTGVVGR